MTTIRGSCSLPPHGFVLTDTDDDSGWEVNLRVRNVNPALLNVIYGLLVEMLPALAAATR